MKSSLTKIAILIMAATLAITLLAYVQEANTATFQDRYIISAETYKQVVPTKYGKIYRHVKRHDKSAARTMVDAARDVCKNTVNRAVFVQPGSESNHPDFDCYTRF